MAGRYFQRTGGSNYMCLPETPRWKNHTDDRLNNAAAFGVKFKLDRNYANFLSTVNNGGAQFHDKPVPCAVCYVSQRSTSVMMSASTSCPEGWTQEYAGYIMSTSLIDHSSSYICVDQAPEVAHDGADDPRSAILTVVQVLCGTLPCSLYHDHWELACVVCAK